MLILTNPQTNAFHFQDVDFSELTRCGIITFSDCLEAPSSSSTTKYYCTHTDDI